MLVTVSGMTTLVSEVHLQNARLAILLTEPGIVTDINEDGTLTYDEALVAAHDAYFEGGSAAGYSAGKEFTSLLWGVSSTNNLFYINEEGLPSGVTLVL